MLCQGGVRCCVHSLGRRVCICWHLEGQDSIGAGWAVTSLPALLSLTTHFISSADWSGAAGRGEGGGGTLSGSPAPHLEHRQAGAGDEYLFVMMRNIFINERRREGETAAAAAATAGRER